MDHAYIDEHQVAERYVLGQLPPEEAARFEEHSFTCVECLERLETAETLRQSLRGVAAYDAQELAAAARLGLLVRLARSRLAPFGLALLLLVALLPSGLLWRQMGRLQDELRGTRVELERRSVSPEALAGLRDQLAGARQERERLAAELRAARSPRADVLLVPLSPMRSGPGRPPATRVSLPASIGWCVLSLELEAAGHPAYRATLLGPDGRIVWQGAGLRPDSQDSLTLALPAADLPTGDATIRVAGLPVHGAPVPVATFSFRIVHGS